MRKFEIFILRGVIWEKYEFIVLVGVILQSSCVLGVSIASLNSINNPLKTASQIALTYGFRIFPTLLLK